MGKRRRRSYSWDELPHGRAMSLDEIGRAMGLTRQAVHYIEREALRKFREAALRMMPLSAWMELIDMEHNRREKER